MKSFGYKLRELRKEKELTQETLVKIMREKYNSTISESMVSKWERNLEEPSRFSDVVSLADFFGVTIDYLLGLTEDKYSTFKETKYKTIPILGTIAAGIPINVQEDIIGYEAVGLDENVDFCLKVRGDSMIGARIFDGDIVFIRKQDIVENGEIVAIQIDNEEVTLKRFYKENGRIILHSENPTIPDLVITSKDKKLIRILGKVVYVKFEAR